MKKLISITSFLFIMVALSHCGLSSKEGETFKTYLDKVETHIAAGDIETENLEALSALTTDELKKKLSFIWSLEQEAVFMAFNIGGFTKKLNREELEEDFDNSLKKLAQELGLEWQVPMAPASETINEDYFDTYEIAGLTLTFKLKENQEKTMRILSITEDTLVLAEMDGDIFLKTETWKKVKVEEQQEEEKEDETK